MHKITGYYVQIGEGSDVMALSFEATRDKPVSFGNTTDVITMDLKQAEAFKDALVLLINRVKAV